MVDDGNTSENRIRQGTRVVVWGDVRNDAGATVILYEISCRQRVFIEVLREFLCCVRKERPLGLENRTGVDMDRTASGVYELVAFVGIEAVKVADRDINV